MPTTNPNPNQPTPNVDVPCSLPLPPPAYHGSGSGDYVVLTQAGAATTSPRSDVDPVAPYVPLSKGVSQPAGRGNGSTCAKCGASTSVTPKMSAAQLTLQERMQPTLRAAQKALDNSRKGGESVRRSATREGSCWFSSNACMQRGGTGMR